jgi:hypothetical protein
VLLSTSVLLKPSPLHLCFTTFAEALTTILTPSPLHLCCWLPSVFLTPLPLHLTPSPFHLYCWFPHHSICVADSLTTPSDHYPCCWHNHLLVRLVINPILYSCSISLTPEFVCLLLSVHKVCMNLLPCVSCYHIVEFVYHSSL